MSTFIRAIGLSLAALAALQSGLALAAEDREGNPIIFPRATSERPNPLGMKPVDAKALAAKRGGAEVVNEMLLKGVVADTRVSNVITGNNVIADGSFAGAAGLPMVIQNSGNSVLIQNSTIVNVQLK